MTDLWPALPLESWRDTYATLHMWLQMVGKTRLALAPMENHWWQVALYVTERGLTTSSIPSARPVAGLLAIDMLGAIALVHLSKGFFLPDGYEFALTLMGGSLALALAGAGEHSLDRMLSARKAEARRHG